MDQGCAGALKFASGPLSLDFAQDEASHNSGLPNFSTKQNPRAFKGTGVFNVQQGVRLNETLTLGALPSKFASAAHSFCFLASLLFRWLFKISARLHFTEQAFTLHLLLEGA